MKQTWFKLIGLLIYCLIICHGADNTIYLSQGKLKGSYNVLGDYWSYLGVPYAKYMGRYKILFFACDSYWYILIAVCPNNRQYVDEYWDMNEKTQEPGDPPLWDDVYEANRYFVVCKQYSTITKLIIGQEDCLTLNVYTPRTPSNTTAAPLSVMIFIHGGGYHEGSNTDLIYNPRYLVQKDVVVVTINYRVGAFGFLCLKIKGVPGNMGLKDQLAALKWVKNNIGCFGGDSGSVTVFGESAGAASIDYLIQTQTAKGLFHRAILESGTSLRPSSFDPKPIETATETASRLGYDTSDSAELLEIFLNATADDVARVSYKDTMNDALAAHIFKPCIEDPSISNTTVLTTNPRQLVKSIGDISEISIIIGYNSKEGIYWAQHYDRNGLKMLDKNFSSAVPDTFTYRKPEYKAELINDIREFYFNNSHIDYDELIKYFSDVMIMGPSVGTATAYMLNPRINMYNYYFSYDSLRNLMKMLSKLRNETRGAAHADELFYLFDPILYRFLPSIPRDKNMIDIMTNLWTNFAKTGVPSTAGFIWPRSETTLKFLKLDKDIEVIGLPNPERIDFWKRSYEKYA